MKNKKVYDISRKVNEETVVWPGDPMTSFRQVSSVEKGDAFTMHRIKVGLHTGTHIDAPMHFLKGGKGIDEIDLSYFLGEAKVFEVSSSDFISYEDVIGLDIQKDDIVLFKTISSNLKEEDAFYEDYVYLHYNAAEYLAKKRIKTVGIDYLSIENFFTEEFETHKILLENGIGIIEGLSLKDVEEGKYFLSCLPLKVTGVEAAPARAVLVEI